MAKRTTGRSPTVKPKAAADLAAKAPTTADLAGAKATAKTLVDQVAAEGEGTHLANADEETAMRKAATSQAARKAAAEAGKKDPLEKWGDPDATPDQIRRATFGV